MFIFNAKLEDAARLEQTLIGRKHIADWLEKQAMNFASTGQPLRELLIGPRGSGKTHLLSVLYNRIAKHPEIQQKVAIAYMSEDEYGIDTYLDLLVRLFKAFTRLVATSEEKERVLQYIEQLKLVAPEQRIAYAERYLLEYLNGRYLLVFIENLNDIFAGINEEGQSQWRDFIQTHDNTGIVATSQAIFKDVNNRSKPFFGFFHITYLPKLSFDDALELMRTLAGYDQRDDLLQHLNTDEGRGNLRAIYELTEGNHRLLVTFYNFLKTDFKCELSRAFLLTLDKLKPYYESFLKLLSHQQQKIIQYLALQRIPQTGTQIAQNCFLQPTTVSKQMSELMRLAYVEAYKEGREAYYEITEPLLRICIEVNEDREGIIKLFVDFLGKLYSPQDLKKGYLRFSLLQDLVNPELRNTYRDEARYYGRAIEAYVDGWKPSPEEQEKVLSLETIEEREQMIEKMVKDGEGFDKKKLKGLVKKKEWIAAEKMLVPLFKDEKTVHMAWFLSSFLYYWQNQFEKAEAACIKALEMKPDFYEAWPFLGILHTKQKAFEKAEVAYQKALEIKPGLSEIWQSLGSLYIEQKSFEKAEAAYQESLEIEPGNDKIWVKLGALYFKQDRFDKAEIAFRKALQIKPDNHVVWNILGFLYKEQNQFEKAEEAYQELLKMKPDDYNSWFNLGYSYEVQNQFEKAEEAYQKALEIKADLYRVWYNLGHLYIAIKEWGKAKEAARQYENYGPDNETGQLLYLSACLGDIQQYFRAASRYYAQPEAADISLLVVMPLLYSKPDMIKSVLSAITSGNLLGKPIVNVLKPVLRVLIKKESSTLKQLKNVRIALDSLYGQDTDFHYPLKYFSLAIRYFREGEKKALYELTKEERKAFFAWAGEQAED